MSGIFDLFLTLLAELGILASGPTDKPKRRWRAWLVTVAVLLVLVSLLVTLVLTFFPEVSDVALPAQ